MLPHHSSLKVAEDRGKHEKDDHWSARGSKTTSGKMYLNELGKGIAEDAEI